MYLGDGTTQEWTCDYCGSHNCTREGDVFSDQCRRCTRYNDLDWSETDSVSVSEARAALD